MSQPPISITLNYFALLREQRGVAEEVLATESVSAITLYQQLAAQYKFTLSAMRIGVAVNNQFVGPDYVLQNGDRVAFIPPVAGG